MSPTVSSTSADPASPMISPALSAERPVAPAGEDVLVSFARSMEIANRKWAGKSFDEMNQACLAVMAKEPKIELKNPPRIP